MYICPECDTPYVLGQGENWNGKCPTCGKFIGNELYKFCYHASAGKVTNLFLFYLPNETYFQLEVSSEPESLDPVVYIAYEEDYATYYSKSYQSLKYFYSGWLYCRSYMTGQLNYRNKFITKEGLIQEN